MKIIMLLKVKCQQLLAFNFEKNLKNTPCPSELGFFFFENTVDADKLASDKAIWSESIVFHWIQIGVESSI